MGELIFWPILLFMLGAGVGSFIAASADRIGKKQKNTGRSQCDKCGHELNVIDLTPIFGWIIRGGKCHYCKKPIGVRPIIIEIISGCLFAASYLMLTAGQPFNIISIIQFVLWLIMLSGLMYLFISDIQYRRMPNRVMYPVMIFSAISWLVTSVTVEHNYYSLIAELGLAMLPLAGFYGIVFWLTKGKMVGLADIKLCVAIGFLLPWQGSLTVLALSNILALLFVLPSLLSGKLKTADSVPFGPFLIISLILVFGAMKFFVNFF